jgi:protein SCO1/2
VRSAAHRLVAPTLAIAAAGAALWLAYSVSRPPPLPEIGGYVLAEPRALPDVALVDEQGALFEPAAFAGRWSFLYFGYTYCPDICPLALLELAEVKRQLEAERPGESVGYYLVSVDPQRDTPERLREYVAYFDPSFRGLTGSAEALTALATASASLFYVPEGQDGEHYLVNHSSNVVLLNPGGAVEAVFTPPHTPAQLVADFTKVRARYEAAHGGP